MAFIRPKLERLTRAAMRYAVAKRYSQNTVLYMRDLMKEREYYIVGTVHISQKSVEEVRNVIDKVKPDCIMVELCPGRARRMMQENSKALATSLTNTYFAGAMPFFGMNIIYDILRMFGIVPGGEFQAAMEEARKRNIPVVYGDRDVHVTLDRVRQVLSLQKVLSLLFRPSASPLFGALNIKKFQDILDQFHSREFARKLLADLEQTFPELIERLVHERDAYMVNSLRNECKGKMVVGVVGLGHLDGIERLLANPKVPVVPPSLYVQRQE